MSLTDKETKRVSLTEYRRKTITVKVPVDLDVDELNVVCNEHRHVPDFLNVGCRSVFITDHVQFSRESTFSSFRHENGDDR